jgi:hypothetical protein
VRCWSPRTQHRASPAPAESTRESDQILVCFCCIQVQAAALSNLNSEEWRDRRLVPAPFGETSTSVVSLVGGQRFQRSAGVRYERCGGNAPMAFDDEA